MAEKLKSVKITWKEGEEWLHDFVWEHSSPSAWFKDLAIEEYKRKRESKDQPTEQSSGKFDFLD